MTTAREQAEIKAISEQPGDADEAAVLKRALEWVSGNYRSTLAGKPVRDADECLLHAELLLKPR